MFRRRKPDPIATPSQPAAAEVEPVLDTASTPHRSFPSQGHADMNTKPPTPPIRPEIPRRAVDLPTGARPATPAAKPADTEYKKLIVGRDISLSGNISACDKLVVEGTVEADLRDARVIEIAESGLFKGSAEVDEAEIGGRFEGQLVVRNKLTIRSTGRVEGTVRYARLIVECGGEIAGSVEVMRDAPRLAAPVADAAPQEPEAPALLLADPQ